MNQAHSIQEIERSTVKKTMNRILPFIMLLYIIAFLDRVNMGYAALKMNADLGLTAEAFGLLSGLYFLSFFFFEVPSNLILQKVGARLWIFRIMITWGIVVILCGFVQTPTHLYILRFLLGAAEAGFVPGIVLYLTYWFRVQDRGRATAAVFRCLTIKCLDWCAAVYLDYREHHLGRLNWLEMDVYFRRDTSDYFRDCGFSFLEK